MSKPSNNNFFCLAKKIGLVHENGSFNLELLRRRIRASIDLDEETNKIIDRCVVKENSEQAIFDSILCLHANVPRFTPFE